MATELGTLNPSALWKIFADICSIPHPSKKEEAIRNYVVEFAKKYNLEHKVDEVGNVILKKAATPGMENRMGIILQGHLDMVPQKNNDTMHDFEKDPIKAVVDGEWVKATGTTLGADNGIGVAAAMAVMASNDIVHGPLECLFTIDEETGMTGAFGLKGGLLSGDILMNLDSEDEGELYIGCAGGINFNAVFKYTQESPDAGLKAYEIKAGGLKGGHSGVDIKLGRANANKILTRFLWQSEREHGLRIASIDGGSLRNAIPREASAIVVIDANAVAAFESFAKEFKNTVMGEFKSVDEGFEFTITGTSMPGSVMDKATQHALINALYACPNGVLSMIPEMPDVVQTSNNMAIVKTENGIASVMCLIRSSVESSKEDLARMIESVFTLAGAEIRFDGAYPGWKPNVDSPILKTMKEIYNKRFGKIPEVKVIHAGLECGLLGDVYRHWDMISFGPTIRYPHSPDERVNIPSVEKFWDYLLETLKNAPLK